MLATLLFGIALFLNQSTFVNAQVIEQIQKRLLSTLGQGFTYQGYLDDSGNPANGSYDFEFGLFDAASGGNQIGSTQSETLSVSDGVFMVVLNSAGEFGANVFDGSELFLEIKVWDTGSNSFVTLTPRQALTAVPYAHFAKKVEPLDNVINVAKSGGDFTTITDALNAITDASATNPYLIRIAPGIYEESIDLKSYVDIEGSGETNTIIRDSGANGSIISAGYGATLRGTGNIVAEVRHLTVESISTDYALAIWTGNVPTDMLKFTHVTAKATTTGVIASGIVNYQSSPTYQHVTALIQGNSGTSYGIHNYQTGASPIIKDTSVSATSNEGVFAIYSQQGASPTIQNVTVHAYGGDYTTGIFTYDATVALTNISVLVENGMQSNTGINNNQSTSTIKNATITANGGIQAFGIDNSQDSVVTLTDVTTSAAGSTSSATGLDMTDSDIIATNVQAFAQGSGTNSGMRTSNYATTERVKMNNIVADAQGGTSSYGFRNAASIALDNAQLSASGASTNHGLYNQNGSGGEIVKVDGSTLSADTSVSGSSGFSIFFGVSQLNGDVSANGGTLKCFQSYDGDYELLTSACANQPAGENP